MGEKGSLRNLYKSFRFFLANKEKIKNKELLAKKKNKTNIKGKDKFKLSFFVFLTSIFGFLFSFISSSEKEKEEIKEIENSSDLLKVKKSVINIVSTIENSKEISIINKCKNDIASTLRIVEKSHLAVPALIAIKKDLENADIKADKKIEIIKIEKIEQQKILLSKCEKIEKINDNLRITKEKIDEIKIKLPKTALKEELIDLKQEVKELEDKLKNNDLKEEDIKKLDQFLLLYNTEEIRILKAKVDEKLKKVSIVSSKEVNIIPVLEEVVALDFIKKEQSFQKQAPEKQKTEIKQVDKKKEQNENKKDIKAKNEEIKLNSSLIIDLKSTTSIVNKQISAMEYKVNEIRKAYSNKPTFFVKIRYMVSNTFRLCASISPFFFFKNKVVGTFTSSILLNNSIRSLRRSISDNKKEISYIRTSGLELLIKEHSEIEKRTKDIFDDSFNQLAIFKTDFISKYGMHINDNIELKNMMKEIYDIEDYITLKQDEYKKENEHLKIKLKRY